MLFGAEALRRAEVSEDEIQAVVEDIRQRDRERMERELTSGTLEASRDLLHSNLPKPAPLIEPRRESKILNPQEVIQAENAEA
jgi:hypothetical protein